MFKLNSVQIAQLLLFAMFAILKYKKHRCESATVWSNFILLKNKNSNDIFNWDLEKAWIMTNWQFLDNALLKKYKMLFWEVFFVGNQTFVLASTWHASILIRMIYYSENMDTFWMMVLSSHSLVSLDSQERLQT